MSERIIMTADQTALSVRVTGAEDGPAMLLCDGIGCDGFVWRYVRRDFEPWFRVIHFHYRGHGRSAMPADTSTFSVEQLAADAWHVLDTLGIDKAVLWGHSMGVQVILEAASQQPRRPLALVPVCGAFEKPLTTFRGSDLGERVLPAVSGFISGRPDAVRDIWRSVVPTDLAYWVAVATEINVRMIRREDFAPYLEHLGSMDPVVFVQLLGRLATHSARRYLPDLDVPTLVFAGSRDHFTPVQLSQNLVDLLPQAQLCVVPGGSHTAPLELPDLVGLRAERFFREQGLMP